MNFPIILLPCLLVSQPPLEKISSSIEEKDQCWYIHYMFNQDLPPDLKIEISGEVAISQHTVHSKPKKSVLSSENPRYCVMESAAGKCYEILYYKVSKRSLLIKIEHKHGDWSDGPLCGKRTITVDKFSETLYLYAGDSY